MKIIVQSWVLKVSATRSNVDVRQMLGFPKKLLFFFKRNTGKSLPNNCQQRSHWLSRFLIPSCSLSLGVSFPFGISLHLLTVLWLSKRSSHLFSSRNTFRWSWECSCFESQVFVSIHSKRIEAFIFLSAASVFSLFRLRRSATRNCVYFIASRIKNNCATNLPKNYYSSCVIIKIIRLYTFWAVEESGVFLWLTFVLWVSSLKTYKFCHLSLYIVSLLKLALIYFVTLKFHGHWHRPINVLQIFHV